MINKLLLYGAAYYDEYMPYERLEKDIQMMKEAGINVVRIAESTWSTVEPHNGEFNFIHIDRVLDAMHKAEIHVIVGTPTYAVPTWMVKEHPEVLAMTPQGQNKYGPRQNMDITSPVYLFYAERVIRKIMEHVKDHPAVIGYQIDNETKHYNTSGPNVQVHFVKYLRQKFDNNLEELNRKFGLDYWSNRINDWEDFPNVDASINASLSGEFAKFQRKLVTDFLSWQIDIVNEYKTENQFVTHNFDFDWRGYSYGIQPDVNHFEAAKKLDIAGCDIYHPSQDDLTGCEISFGGDITRSMKRDNYLVLETEAQAFIGWTPYPGQLKLQAFAHIASGANMVSYWHWHSLHNAAETYWKGLLSHDFEPNPTYLEAKIIGKAFQKLGNKLVNLKKSNKVAILFSNEALTALNAFSGFQGKLNYNDVLRLMYDALYHMNVECDFIDPCSEEIEEYKLLIVPPLYAASDALLDRLNRFVKNGGHIVYAMRSGFSDENVKVRSSHQPGIIEEACGIYYSQLAAANEIQLKDYSFDVTPEDTKLSAMIELITPVSAKVLAKYDHPYWGEYAAVTQNQYGKGIATYIACLPKAEVMQKILEVALKNAGLWGINQGIIFPLVVKTGINQSGKTVRYYFNFSMEAQEFTYPHQDGVELLQNQSVTQNENIQMEAWDIKIIEEN
ncbi:beta-galactosidase [Scatolibacter rhodanostii]|uniref:beta-galactosidase n=1 Tax=Scatolibacter rhodanostii TaxID=2014781 RepID=UPI00190EACE4|nr:beta-galactosidase [Scatolibacter rhodanostii]